MSENTDKNPIFCGSVSVRLGEKRVKMELSEAALFDGQDGDFRVRIARRWLPSFYSPLGLLSLIRHHLLQTDIPKKPKFKVNDKVSVSYFKNGDLFSVRTFISAEPILTFEGVWMCPVFIPMKGVCYIDCKDIKAVAGKK